MLSIEKSRAAKIKTFDANGLAAASSNIFGLPFTAEESDLVLLPIPWEATVSYQGGTADGPAAIKAASAQVDLYEPINPKGWHRGIAMLPELKNLKKLSKKLRPLVEEQIENLASGKTNKKSDENLAKINAGCREMNNAVYEISKALLADGKKVGLVGGDHSTPLGYIKALAEEHKQIGILQIDAHCDLRPAYEGFEFSHASIMYNALKIDAVKKLVQVGIRDYCEQEYLLIKNSKGRVQTFFDRDMKHDSYKGKTWAKQCDEIIKALPAKVYISFDIDGLDAKLCPHTGTAVPGGLEFEQAVYLLEQLHHHKKQIIGFDLNEVAPGKDEWDANVGARLLFKMCNLMLLAK